MAVPPCSPWRIADERGDAARPVPSGVLSPYAGTALELDAPLFRMFAAHEVWPDAVDEWENWQAAEVLEGLLDRAHAYEHAGSRKKGRSYAPRTARVTGAAPVRSERDLLAERVAAAREGRPPPQPDPDSGAGMAPLVARLAAFQARRDASTDDDDG